MPLLSSLAAAAFGPPKGGPEPISGECTDGVPLLSPDGELLLRGDGVIVSVKAGPAMQAGAEQKDADTCTPLPAGEGNPANARPLGSSPGPDLPPFPEDQDAGSGEIASDIDEVISDAAEGMQPPQNVEAVAAACLRTCVELEKTISRDVLTVGSSRCSDSEFATRSTVGASSLRARGCCCKSQLRFDAAHELSQSFAQGRGGG